MSTPEPTIDALAPGRPPVLRTLIRREFWEHRALWMAPLSVAALLLIGAIIGKVSFDSSLAALPEQRRALFGVFMAYAAIPQFITLGIITWMYAGDCLYTERKDRSILFWKSMPVSDTLTVLSKLLVVMVIVPLGILPGLGCHDLADVGHPPGSGLAGSYRRSLLGRGEHGCGSSGSRCSPSWPACCGTRPLRLS